MTEINIKDLPKNAIIIDVRSPEEHAEISLKQPHFNIELSTLNPTEFLKEHNIKNETIYLLCRSGRRSAIAAQKFEDADYKNVKVIEGGIEQAIAENIPLQMS